MWSEILAYLDRYTCPFYKHTGFPCPGCGGTRAVFALLRGDLAESFLYHPMILYMAAAGCIFVLVFLYHRFLKREPYHALPYIRIALLAGAAVIIIQWVVKLVWQITTGNG